MITKKEVYSMTTESFFDLIGKGVKADDYDLLREVELDLFTTPESLEEEKALRALWPKKPTVK